MKTLLALALLTSAPAFAANDVHYYCQGIGHDEGKTMFAKLLGEGDIQEGQKRQFLLVVRDGKETVYSGHVNAKTEDVMLSFKGPFVTGMIYADELNETWLKINGKEMRFDCSAAE